MRLSFNIFKFILDKIFDGSLCVSFLSQKLTEDPIEILIAWLVVPVIRNSNLKKIEPGYIVRCSTKLSVFVHYLSLGLL